MKSHLIWDNKTSHIVKKSINPKDWHYVWTISCVYLWFRLPYFFNKISTSYDVTSSTGRVPVWSQEKKKCCCCSKIVKFKLTIFPQLLLQLIVVDVVAKPWIIGWLPTDTSLIPKLELKGNKAKFALLCFKRKADKR